MTTYNHFNVSRGVVDLYAVVLHPNIVLQLLYKHLLVTVDLLDDDLFTSTAVFPHPIDRQAAVGRTSDDIWQLLHLLGGQGRLASGGEVWSRLVFR